MSRLATMGTASCATIALSGFSMLDIKRDQEYLSDPSSFKYPNKSVRWFYDEILYPTEQVLGRTDEYPFTRLMQEIGKSDMKDKFIITTLSNSQTQFEDGYWLDKLKEFDFVLLEKTDNNIGEVCHIFTRDLAKVE